MPKKKIHPSYHQDVEVVCISGHTFTVNAAVEGPIRVEVCPQCHPTYTGTKTKQVAKGRMEKFMERQKKIDKLQQTS